MIGRKSGLLIPNNSLQGHIYYKKQTISQLAGASANFQLPLTVLYNGTPADNSEVNLGGKCLYDFQDVKFYASDGVTELSYWIEGQTNGDNMKVWVKLTDDLSAGDVAYYICYGKHDDTSSSSIDDVADYYDNGTTTTLDTDTKGSATITHNDGAILTEDSVDDAGIIGKVLSEATNKSARLVNMGEFSSGVASTQIQFGFFNEDNINEFLGLAANVIPKHVFYITRFAIGSGYDNKFAIRYIDAGATYHYWNSSAWQTGFYASDAKTGGCTPYIYTDDANFYANILDSAGDKIFANDAEIAIASARAMAEGVCLAASETFTDYYIASGKIAEKIFIGKYGNSAPTYGAWSTIRKSINPLAACPGTVIGRRIINPLAK